MFVYSSYKTSNIKKSLNEYEYKVLKKSLNLTLANDSIESFSMIINVVEVRLLLYFVYIFRTKVRNSKQTSKKIGKA